MFRFVYEDISVHSIRVVNTGKNEKESLDSLNTSWVSTIVMTWTNLLGNNQVKGSILTASHNNYFTCIVRLGDIEIQYYDYCQQKIAIIANIALEYVFKWGLVSSTCAL